MNITKDEYILNSLSKIKHKKWELFIISRIIHGLDDSEIEFVCQQAISRNEKKTHPYLVDLYFPQFGLYLEIDEEQHGRELHKISDIQRSQDILEVSDLEDFHIKVFEEKDSVTRSRSLSDVAKNTDSFIDMIKGKKTSQFAQRKFKPWDFEMKFSPIPHIELGHISLNTNAVFKNHRDALQCFGYSGGDYQQATWPLINDSSREVWFPTLYEPKDWDNSLSEDGTKIIEKKKDGTSINSKTKNEKKWKERIVFAKDKDEFGNKLYRYVGVFRREPDESNSTMSVFMKIADEVKTIPAPKI